MKIKTFLASMGLTLLAALSLTSCGNDAGMAKANLKKYSKETTKEDFLKDLEALEEKYTLKRKFNSSTYDYDYEYTLADLYLGEYESTDTNASRKLNGKTQKAKGVSKTSEILQYDVDTDCLLKTKVTSYSMSSPEGKSSKNSSTKTQSQVEMEKDPYSTNAERKCVYEYDLTSNEKERDYTLTKDSIGKYRNDIVSIYSKIRNTINSMRNYISLDVEEKDTNNDSDSTNKNSSTFNIKYFKDNDLYTIEYERIRETSSTSSDDENYSYNSKSIEKGIIQISDGDIVLCVSKVKTTGEAKYKEDKNDIYLKYTSESFKSLEFKNSGVTIDKLDDSKFTSVNISNII